MEKNSHHVIASCLDRYIRSGSCRYSIVKDKEFLESRNVLAKWEGHWTLGTIRQREAKNKVRHIKWGRELV